MNDLPESTILIIDDLASNIQILATFLEAHGYSVTYALSGQDALQRLPIIRPDLILLDLRMPGISGLEVCAHIKADPIHRQIPILFMTASHEESHIIAAFDQGADDYITKPFQTEEVLARIKTHLKIRQQTLELHRSRTQLETIISHMKDGLVVLDQHGKILFVNPATAHMFNKPLDELLGHELGIPIVGQKATKIEIMRLNGEVGMAEITVATADWNDQPAWIVCVRDVSDCEVPSRV